MNRSILMVRRFSSSNIYGRKVLMSETLKLVNKKHLDHKRFTTFLRKTVRRLRVGAHFTVFKNTNLIIE